jgi:hypothetical protein
MRQFPTLTSDAAFSIERVTRRPDLSFEFDVIVKLSNGERRSVCVTYTSLTDFVAFSSAALASANVLLRHEGEMSTAQGRRAWLDLIDAAIRQAPSNGS